MKSFNNLISGAMRGLLIICLAILIFLVILYLIVPYNPYRRAVPLRAAQTHCRANLQWIYKALKLYAERNQGNFPERLGPEISLEDFPYAPTPKSILICYSRHKSKEAEKYKISYEYIKGRKLGMPPNTILAFDKAGNHNYKGFGKRHFGRNVLFVDGNIEWFSEDDFQKLLLEKQ